MAKNAIVARLKSAHRYHSTRPYHLLLADGTQSGITATKNAGAGLQLLCLFAPDGSSDVANWKTAPVSGGARHTQYSGNSLAATSVTGWAWIETPRALWLSVESSGPVMADASVYAGEVIVGHDSTLGESSTYGHADGRTITGMLVGRPNKANSTGNWGAVTNPQGRVFLGAEATRRNVVPTNSEASNFSATEMTPAGYGTGDWTAREVEIKLASSFRIGHPAWATCCKEGAYYAARTLGGATMRVLGSSATISHVVTSPYRKDNASADTLYHRRTVATYANWTDFLQAIWDDMPSLTYWEQDSSA